MRAVPLDGQVDPGEVGSIQSYALTNPFLLAWEDLRLSGGVLGDDDSDDIICLVDAVSRVPEPGTLLLLGAGVATLFFALPPFPFYTHRLAFEDGPDRLERLARLRAWLSVTKRRGGGPSPDVLRSAVQSSNGLADDREAVNPVPVQGGAVGSGPRPASGARSHLEC